MMDPSKRIRLVCFDVGGVLIRICRTWEEGCRAAGIQHRNHQGINPTSTAHKQLLDRFQRGEMTGEEFYRHASKAMNGLYGEHEIRSVFHAWLIEQYADVDAVVASLHEQSIQTAALSNTNHDHWVRMDEFPVMGLLNHRLASHKLGMIKPDAAIFEALERHVGFSGSSILYIDDLKMNVDAAAEFGWCAHQVDPLKPTAGQIVAIARSAGCRLPSLPEIGS